MALAAEELDDAQLQQLIGSSALCTALRMCYGEDAKKQVIGEPFDASFSFKRLLEMIRATEIGINNEFANVLQLILNAAVPDLRDQPMEP